MLTLAAERGDLPMSPLRDAGHLIALEAAVALILQWQILRHNEIEEKDIETIVDVLILPAIRGPVSS